MPPYVVSRKNSIVNNWPDDVISADKGPSGRLPIGCSYMNKRGILQHPFRSGSDPELKAGLHHRSQTFKNFFITELAYLSIQGRPSAESM